MTDDLIIYILFLIVGVLVILSFVIGLEKMIKVMLWNYVLWTICLAASQSISLLIEYLTKNPDTIVAGMSAKTFATFLSNGQATIVLLIYALLLFLLYQKSTISIRIPTDDIIQKSLYMLLVPLTVFSMILTIQICLIWGNIISMWALETIALDTTKNIYLQQYIMLTPVWIFLHGIATLLITSEFKIKIKTQA